MAKDILSSTPVAFMLTGARMAAISLALAFLVIFAVALPTKLTCQDMEGTEPCYGDFCMLWFSGGIEGIGRYLGDNSDWSESSQIAYYLYITI